MAEASFRPETACETEAVRQVREDRRAHLAAVLTGRLAELPPAGSGDRGDWLRKSRGAFFFAPQDIPARIALLDREVPGRNREIVAAADQVLRHEFDILGSGLVPLGNPIDWHRDFKSEISWRSDVVYPNWNWRKVDAAEEVYRGHFYSIEDASDLKVPWDLSSLFHFPLLGEAWHREREDKYAREILTELEDWHAKNPYPRGVNWTCAMVVGIRLVNLVFGLRLLEGRPDTAEFLDRVGTESILRHCIFILENLEIDRDGRRNNHYLNNLVGLAFGAAEFGRDPAGAALLDFVADEVAIEIGTQFSADGTNYEGTIPYHRFATESLLLTLLLLDRNGRPPSPESRRQLRRMLNFIDAYTKSNGLAPQVGDNDNGRILVLHNYRGQEYRDHRHILAVGLAYLGEPAMNADLSGQSADVIWLLGRPAPARGGIAGSTLMSACHADNGHLLARAGISSLYIRCGRINAMSGGGHNHCDQLSFEWHDLGCDVVIDSGAYIYSADSAARNAYRATAAHNVVQLDDHEQQGFELSDLFGMKDRAGATLDVWNLAGSELAFLGRHRGFSAFGWELEREITGDLRSGKLQIRDRPLPVGDVQTGAVFCGRLHLAADINANEFEGSEWILESSAGRWRVRFGQSLQVSKRAEWVSPSYGIKEPAVVLEYRFRAESVRSPGGAHATPHPGVAEISLERVGR